jgi:ankyrin repeat protein
MKPRHTAILDLLTEPRYQLSRYDFNHYYYHYRYSEYLTFVNHSTSEALSVQIAATLGEQKEQDRQAFVTARTKNDRKNSFHLAFSGLFNSSLRSMHHGQEILPLAAFNQPQSERKSAPATIPLATHINQQNEQLHRIVSALLVPFEHKAGETKENLARDIALASALTELDTEGFTPLHLAYKNHLRADSLAPLFTRIAEMNSKSSEITSFKAQILTAENHDKENILHGACQSRSTIFRYFINSFGTDAVSHAIHRVDKKGYTPLHWFFKSNLSHRTADFKVVLEQKGLLESPDIFLLQTKSHGENVLHMACNRAVDKKDDFALLDILCTYLESFERPEHKDEPGSMAKKSIKEQAVSALTNDQRNALHHACQSGNSANVIRLLQHLSPECKQEIAKAKTKEGFTALHLACRYGDQTMLKTISDALGPEETYRITRVESAEKLRTLINQNDNENGLSLDDYENLLTQELCLIEGYEYLKQRSLKWNFTQKQVEDYNNRLTDFANCLTRANNGQKILPNRQFNSQRYWCFFKSTEHYQTKRHHFQKANATTTTAFFKFLASKNEAVAKELLKKIPPLKEPTLLEVKAVAAPTPSAPPADPILSRGEGEVTPF